MVDVSNFVSVYHDDAAEKAAEEKQTDKPRVNFVQNPDGTTTVTGPDGKQATYPNPAKVAEETMAEQSAARARLEEIKVRRGSHIVEHDLGGEKWYILRLDLPHAVEAAHAASELCNGQPFELKNPEVMTAIMVAMMRAAVVSGPDDSTPYFEDDAIAREYVEEPGTMGLCANLFALISNENESLIPLLQGAMGRTTTADAS
jgi:hypothetical protein